MNCLFCYKKGTQRHEIWYGNDRQTSIKYKLQVLLCIDHHIPYIHKDGRKYGKGYPKIYRKEIFIELDMFSDFLIVERIMNRNCKEWNEKDIKYMKFIGNRIQDRLKKKEIKKERIKDFEYGL